MAALEAVVVVIVVIVVAVAAVSGNISDCSSSDNANCYAQQ